ncbi:hypothetical protein [Streptomyces sp. NBC_00859]|uniref:hypothetical protein n=1 Tax=Streptomyces sp. NBC_00859 TaxID=2903682 RepID=UPI003866713C|nr:hypothetical protein OG584_23245 [Streptomyces sp. NBC_00859]
MPPRIGEVDDARVLPAAEPAQGEHAAGYRGAERSGEVVALFRPVHAAAERGAPARKGLHVDSDGAAASLTGAVVAACCVRGTPDGRSAGA